MLCSRKALLTLPSAIVLLLALAVGFQRGDLLLSGIQSGLTKAFWRTNRHRSWRSCVDEEPILPLWSGQTSINCTIASGELYTAFSLYHDGIAAKVSTQSHRIVSSWYIFSRHEKSAAAGHDAFEWVF
jgi:hypothetical protein